MPRGVKQAEAFSTAIARGRRIEPMGCADVNVNGHDAGEFGGSMSREEYLGIVIYGNRRMSRKNIEEECRERSI